MAEKRLPIGICDHCEEEISVLDWYTAHGQPRRYCSIDCRNTANSRAGNPVRTAKLRQAVAEGRWQNPHHLHPPTGAEQAARARKGRLRDVADGRWRRPRVSSSAGRASTATIHCCTAPWSGSSRARAWPNSAPPSGNTIWPTAGSCARPA